jgi:hypothetical protein
VLIQKMQGIQGVPKLSIKHVEEFFDSLGFINIK